MGRFSFVGRRLVQMIPVAVGVTIIAFLLIPGDPTVAILGNHYRAEGAAHLRAALGLDKPLWVQYLIILILVLSVNLHLFPVTGFGDTVISHVWHLFLPALNIALGFGAVLIRREYRALRAVAPGRIVACHLYQPSAVSSQPSA